MQQRLPFHQQLKLERERRGWSQADLAERMGKISVRTIRRWERGESLPQSYYRQKFSELFGKGLEELGLVQVQAYVKQLCQLTGKSPNTVYEDVKTAFEKPRYQDLLESEWEKVETWFRIQIDRVRKK